jgi:hypothetical protein
MLPTRLTALAWSFLAVAYERVTKRLEPKPFFSSAERIGRCLAFLLWSQDSHERRERQAQATHPVTEEPAMIHDSERISRITGFLLECDTKVSQIARSCERNQDRGNSGQSEDSEQDEECARAWYNPQQRRALRDTRFTGPRAEPASFASRALR